MAETKHVTLAAGAATNVTTTRDVREIGVLHKGNTQEPIYVRCDGTTAAVKGANTYTILPTHQRWIPRIWSAGRNAAVSIISAGAVEVEVEFP